MNPGFPNIQWRHEQAFPHWIEWWLSGKSTIPEQTKIAVDYLDIPWFIVRISKFPQTYQQISSHFGPSTVNWHKPQLAKHRPALANCCCSGESDSMASLNSLGVGIVANLGARGAWALRFLVLSSSSVELSGGWNHLDGVMKRVMICFIHVKNTFGVMNQLITGWPRPVIVAAWYSFFKGNKMQHAIKMAKRCKTIHKIINWPPCAAIQQVSVRLNNNFEYGQKFAGGASDSQIWVTNYLVGAEFDQPWYPMACFRRW